MARLMRGKRRDEARKARTLRYWRIRKREVIHHRVQVGVDKWTGERIYETHNQEVVI